MNDYASVTEAVAALGALDLTLADPLAVELRRSYSNYTRWAVDIHATAATFERSIGASRLNEVVTKDHDAKYVKREVFIAEGIKVFCLVEKDVQEIYSERLTELETADAAEREVAKAQPADGAVDLAGALRDAVDRAKAVRS